MVVATRRSFDWTGTVQRGARIRVATKYVKTAREHFAQKGMHVDLIRFTARWSSRRSSASPT
jgi:ATP phosphoribosyltransferase